MNRLQNLARTILIVAAMIAISSLLGYLMFGLLGVIGSVAAGVIMLVLSPNLSPGIILRVSGAAPLSRFHAPELHRLLDLLSERPWSMEEG